jgi:hypothetical protein
MPQLILPIFPAGATHITDVLSFENRDGQITYFHGGLPIFSHAKDDVQAFRMITSQFYINGHVKQKDIVRAFGVTDIFVKRGVKIYRKKGVAGFYEQKNKRGAAVLVPEVLIEIQERLNSLESIPSIATNMNLKQDTIRKAIASGRLKKVKKKKEHVVQN